MQVLDAVRGQALSQELAGTHLLSESQLTLKLRLEAAENLQSVPALWPTR